MLPAVTSFAKNWLVKHAAEFESYGYNFSWIPGAVQDAAALDDVIVALAHAGIKPFSAYTAGAYLHVDKIFKCWRSLDGYELITPYNDYMTKPENWEFAAQLAFALGLIVCEYAKDKTVENRCPYVILSHASDLTKSNLKKYSNYLYSTSPTDYKKIQFEF